jgi:hypothetical protein
LLGLGTGVVILALIGAMRRRLKRDEEQEESRGLPAELEAAERNFYGRELRPAQPRFAQAAGPRRASSTAEDGLAGR